MSDLYKLGDYVVDGLRRQIRLDDTVIPMQQKPFEVLLLLIARSGRVVSKDELMQEVWPDSFVEEANLTQSIFLLRKAFSDKAAGSRYIVTVPGRGYQLGVEPIAIDTAAQRPEIESVVASASPALGDAGKAPRPPAKLRTPMLRVMAVVAAAGLLLVGLLIWRSLHPAPFSHFSVRRLTNSGDVKLTAISRTGRYLAMVTRSSAGRESLSVTDLHGGNAHVILSPEGAVFKDVEVSPDDAYVYYRSHAEGSSLGTFSVSRIPLLGGEPTLVVNDVDGPVSFLDGGARLCFWRGNGENQFAILSVEADSGKDEKTLAGNLQMMPSEVVCSPDGQRAAISREVGGIVLLDLKTGSIKPFYSSSQGDEFYMDMSWKSDGSGLLTSVVSPFNLYPSLIFISYPGGKRTRITNELSSYSSAGVTEDGSAIVALQRDKNAQFQSFDLPLLALNPAVSPDVISFAWTDFLGWHNDDQIVGSTAAGGLKMKTVADSQERFVQTAHGVQFLQPNGCGTAALVAAGGRPPDKAISIWHMNADGSQLKQISAGPEDILPVCSVDGKWVFYADNSSRGKASVYRIAAEGGTPLKYETGTVWFAVSHSGEKLAWISGSGGQQKLMLADTASGKSVASTTLPATLRAARSLTFGPDDQHIFFTVTGETSDSVFEMPVGEMPVGDPVAALSKNDEQVPVKRIEFRAAHLATIMVSPGGKHLGVVTVKPTADAVMLEDRR